MTTPVRQPDGGRNRPMWDARRPSASVPSCFGPSRSTKPSSAAQGCPRMSTQVADTFLASQSL